MNIRSKLAWFASGLAIGTIIWLGTTVLVPTKAGTQRQLYLALIEPPEMSPPRDSGQFDIERLRDRDAGNEIYVGKIAFECGAQSFEFESQNHSIGEITIPLETTSTRSLDCIAERARREKISVELREVPFAPGIFLF